MRDTSGMPADEHGEAALPPADSHPRAAFIAHLGDLARPIARRYFRVPLGVERKADESPVTRADRDIETALRTEIRNSFPADGLFGEEHGTDNLQAPRVWVVDPIDGTKSFISGLPMWGTLIGLKHNGRPCYGMMSQPFTRERFFGDGQASFWTGPAHRGSGQERRRLRTRPCADVAEATVMTTSPRLLAAERRAAYERVESLAKIPRYGGDCYAYCALAAGHVDLVIEDGLNAYDIVALIPIIEGAGGVVTTWEGGDASQGGSILAAGDSRAHEQAMKLLRG